MGVKNIPLTMEIRNQFTNNEVKLPLKVGVKFYKIDPFHQVDIQKYIQQNDKKAG
jgi:c-di-GMP-binding flagellar brake protein YcgR